MELNWLSLTHKQLFQEYVPPSTKAMEVPIVMDSKYMGNDFSISWPSAEIAVMGAKGAVEILHRNAAPEERSILEEEYDDRLLNPYIAAERSVDIVIKPCRNSKESICCTSAASNKERETEKNGFMPTHPSNPNSIEIVNFSRRKRAYFPIQ